MFTGAGRGFSPNPGELGNDRTYSLDTLPQEYSTCGAGDFRLPSIEAELADGSHITDLRYAGFAVRKGKYALDGLPAFFAREDEADTLVLSLEDPASKLSAELYYGVFEDYDLIQRGDYYRLSDPLSGPYTAWEQVSPDGREALVSLVYGSNHSAAPFRMLRLKGLGPTVRYRVNGGDEPWPGDVLMAAGYPLSLPFGDYQSLQLYLEAE